MIDDRAVSTVQTVLAETRWLPVPCPTEYLPALARDVLYALEKAGMAVVQLPPHESILSTLDQMAGLRYYFGTEKGFQIGAALLAAASAAESVSVVAPPQERP